MTVAALPRISEIRPMPDYRLAVMLEQGGQIVVSFADSIKRGGVFSFLRDETVFSTVRIDKRHRTIFWRLPKGREDDIVDVDAESLIEMARAQAA